MKTYLAEHVRGFWAKGMTFDVAMTADVDGIATKHLLSIHQGGDSFRKIFVSGLWVPSQGGSRTTALCDRILLPEEDERLLHGGASFQPSYFDEGGTNGGTREEGAGVHAQSPQRWVARDESTGHRGRAGRYRAPSEGDGVAFGGIDGGCGWLLERQVLVKGGLEKRNGIGAPRSALLESPSTLCISTTH